MRSVLHPSAMAMAVLLLSGAAHGQAEATTQPAGNVLYEDADAKSSATITQVLPNSSTNLLTLGNVRRIRVVQEVLIVEWGTTATTLLPRQFVASINVNKRAPVQEPREPGTGK